ncbi:hypothetical protein PUV54_13750 [Hyphococcus flavus]|uniref:EF-hand domain-containing protein n=1 Tax=Hyphococcus flavus TaxID=1866326 RepID=A0AAF0CFJ8_9PROT|nr:hypothetical protein [Hyphococcus flavus]WDI31018.1 hypothetical protein PUV54_13750 [Hyphococcus flavus]
MSLVRNFSVMAFTAFFSCNAMAFQENDDASTADPAASAETESDTSNSVDADNMADLLNSRQQLQQSFTLQRTVNGEVVETEKRTVTYSRDQPYRETEAGKTTVQRLKERYDREALTRTEAFEEAKLDFVIADANRDGAMTAQEFADLVNTWRLNEARQAEAPNNEIAQQRKYDAFLAEIDPDTAEMQTKAYALEKFAFMAGAAETLSLQDFIRETMLDFDSMDADKDTILTGEELARFRALNRGETVDQ